MSDTGKPDLCDGKMRIDLLGMLKNHCKRDDASRFMLTDHFYGHLKELRDRHAAGDASVVNEFFDLYVIHD